MERGPMQCLCKNAALCFARVSCKTGEGEKEITGMWLYVYAYASF